MSTQVAALVPAALFECISQFRLGGEVDNVLDGLTPFMTVPPNYHCTAGTQFECNTSVCFSLAQALPPWQSYAS